jgi:hypothetical protein
MIARSPATSVVAALDAPWRFLRSEFPRWAPAAFALAALGMLPGLVTQYAAGALDPTSGDVDFSVLGVVYASACGTILFTAVSQLCAYVIAFRVVYDEPVDVLDALLGALSPRMLIFGGLTQLLVIGGFGCIVGGPIVVGLLGFVPVAVLARPGVWLDGALGAVRAALTRASPLGVEVPFWRLAAIALVWWGISAVIGQLAALPTTGWMLWALVSSLGAGNALDALQVQPPFAVGATAVLLGAVVRPFAEMYLAAGVVLLWKDLARVRAGDDLLALADDPRLA